MATSKKPQAEQGRIYGYARVSTNDQTATNQVQELAAAWHIPSNRIVTETISGSVPAMARPGFTNLLAKMEPGETLVVSKLDRLGRDAMDVRATVEQLADAGIKVRCLQLGDADLTSAAGKMIMQVLNAMAEFERDLLIERTQAGLQRARAEGKKFGRPPALTDKQRDQVRAKLAAGMPVAQLAREYDTTRQTIMRVRDVMREAAAEPTPAPTKRSRAQGKKEQPETDHDVRQHLEKKKGQRRIPGVD